MLSEQEKKEMLEDARSLARRQDFIAANEKGAGVISFDDYLCFLNSIQLIFAQFKVSHQKTITKQNRL